MASGTVGYTDTRGSRDYTSIIANQIGKRLKEASDMASDERSFAEKQAEAGGTSLEEAGIGKGYFFGKALGSRFGGDAIARTRGRMGAQGAGKNPAASYKQRFRGGFDYNVTNQVLTDTAPLTSALVTGLRGVESGLDQVSSAIQKQDQTLSNLARSQADMAKATMFNGYLFQMFATQQRRERERRSARNEERSIEGRGNFGTGSRRMINVTPGGVGRGTGGGLKNSLDFGDVARRVTAEGFSRGTYRAAGATAKATTTAAKVLKAGGNIPKVAKNLDPLLSLSKGARNMLKMPGASHALKNMVGGVAKTTKNPRTFEKIAKAATVPGNITKVSKQLKSSKNAIVDLSKGLNRTGDAIDITEIGAKTPRKITKAYSAAENIVTGGPDSIKAVTTSPELMNQIKNADKVSDGLASSKVVAAAADAGAKPNMLKRFLFGVKPKGLVRGSALTRMLVKNPAGKMFLKKLPLIGAVAGTIFAAQRLMEGDFLGAGLELGSGILGAVGAAPASLAIDGFLLARDFGAVPFEKGGIVRGRRGKGLYTMLGAGLPSVVGEGGSDEAVLPLNKKTFRNFGQGFIDAIKDNKSEYAKITSMGVFAGIGSARSGGLFDGLVDSVGDTISNVKDSVSNVLQKINPVNLFKPDANGKNFFQRIGSGVTNWWNKGMKPNEGKMSWKDLISDDWNQRQRTGGAGKGSWNPFRGMPGYGTVKNFLTGKPGNEIAGGFQTGPTPLIRQSVLRGAGLLMNPKAAILAALMKPTALADGTLTGVTNGMESMNLQNPTNGNAIATTVVNNNYYQNGANGGAESRDETLGQSFNMDLEKFITNYSIMAK